MNKFTGSNFDDFLREEGIYDEVTTRALKRLLSLQMQDALKDQQMTKTSLANRLNTSRSQLDRLLDPDYTSVTLDSLSQLASALGKQLRIEIV